MHPTTQATCCGAQDLNSLREATFYCCKWKVMAEYQNFIKEHCADVTPSCVENAWNNLKDYLLSGVDKVCGKTKDCRGTWWWNNAVNDVVKEKQYKWKQWKLGGSKGDYQLAKKAASHTVYDAKQQAQSEYF